MNPTQRFISLLSDAQRASLRALLPMPKEKFDFTIQDRAYDLVKAFEREINKVEALDFHSRKSSGRSTISTCAAP